MRRGPEFLRVKWGRRCGRVRSNGVEISRDIEGWEEWEAGGRGWFLKLGPTWRDWERGVRDWERRFGASGPAQQGPGRRRRTWYERRGGLRLSQGEKGAR